jgi:uncharacterized protein
VNRHGDFVWYELMTPDPAAAETFYGAVVGWTARDQGGGDYRLLAAADGDVGGVLPLAKDTPMPPGWFAYLAVDDVDATVAAAKTAGASVHMGPQTLEGVGRMAFLSDPQGAAFYVMRGDGDGESRAFAPGAPGHGAWNELVADDPDAAIGFYSGLFGWTRGQVVPMGEMGDYQLMSHGGRDVGAIMRRPPNVPHPVWTAYFQVEDLDAACERVRSAGGQVVFGPVPVPGDERIIMGVDPQGASFALVGR